MTNRRDRSSRREPDGRATTVLLQECATPFGPIHIAATERGLCRITVPGEGLAALFAWLERYVPGADVNPAGGALDAVTVALHAYFAGVPLPNLPVDLRGTPFQCAVWREVRAIAYGETRSYAEIARAIGHPLAARAVGAANAVNPLPFVVPCHRVIGADGTIKGYPGGIVTRQTLLEREGAWPPAPARYTGR